MVPLNMPPPRPALVPKSVHRGWPAVAFVGVVPAVVLVDLVGQDNLFVGIASTVDIVVDIVDNHFNPRLREGGDGIAFRIKGTS